MYLGWSACPVTLNEIPSGLVFWKMFNIMVITVTLIHLWLHPTVLSLTVFPYFPCLIMFYSLQKGLLLDFYQIPIHFHN